MLNGNKTAKKIKTAELPKIRLAATTAPNSPFIVSMEVVTYGPQLDGLRASVRPQAEKSWLLERCTARVSSLSSRTQMHSVTACRIVQNRPRRLPLALTRPPLKLMSDVIQDTRQQRDISMTVVLDRRSSLVDPAPREQHTKTQYTCNNYLHYCPTQLLG